MHYRLDRERVARHGVIAILSAFVLTVAGLLLFSRTPPSATGAWYAAPATAEDDPTLRPGPSSVSAAAPATTIAATDTTAATTATTTTTTSTTLAPTTTAAPTTTVPPSTIFPAETLPEQLAGPIDPPLDADGAEPLVPLGGIIIPKIGLEAPMHEGIRLTTLDYGPGHWPGTAMPGEVGNAVIAAHRTSHGAEFRNVDQLVPGDEVRFETAAGVSVYRVVETEVVTPDAVWIVDQTPTATATLFACHPPGSVSHRIVVHLELET
jgi:sortase A